MSHTAVQPLASRRLFVNDIAVAQPITTSLPRKPRPPSCRRPARWFFCRECLEHCNRYSIIMLPD